MNNNQSTIYQAANSSLYELGLNLESSFSKSHLAKLRQSINRQQLPIEIMALVFKYLPDQYLGTGGKLTPSENSILLAVQLYAMHQQGNDKNVHVNDKKKNIGKSLNHLRTDERRVNGLDRRFNAMVTASTLEEMIHHLRHLIKMTKGDITLDYALLAQDIFNYHKGFENEIRLKWSRQYYRNTKQEEKGEE